MDAFRFLIRLRCTRLSIFVSLISLYNILAYNLPLNYLVISTNDFTEYSDFLKFISVQVVQICLLASFMYLLSFISVFFAKFIGVFLFVTNSIAVYFMLNYGIVIDVDMIDNLFSTNTREAYELWHPSILFYIIFLGIIPSVIIILLRVSAPSRIMRFCVGASFLICLSIWLFLTPSTTLWIGKNDTRLGGRILPWSYIVNTARYFDFKYLEKRAQIKLPDANFLNNFRGKQVVVLVIGESARAANMSIYGYQRETNKFTSELDLSVFPIGQACGTRTKDGTACILTHLGHKSNWRTEYEPLPNYLTRHGIYTIILRNNNGTPPISGIEKVDTKALTQSCDGKTCLGTVLDSDLIEGIGSKISNIDHNRIFVLVHLRGSHGPLYYKQYAPKFEKFKPVCQTSKVAECSYESLVNAYDNSILFTDYLLSDLIQQLKGLKDTQSMVMYVSDHGESLGENGFYFHSAPPYAAPPEQTNIPFWIWMSEEFKEVRDITSESIIKENSYPHDFPFHSILGAFDMRSEIYNKRFDVFSKN